MMLAYVLGRPMPCFSSSLISVASVYRGGLWVKCCVGARSIGATGLPWARSGSSWSSLLTPATFMKPSNTSLRPLARKTASPASVGATIVAVVWSNSAGGIWQATNRFQIRPYSRASSGPSLAAASLGVSDTSVGRIASWASWALLLLLL